VIGLFFFSPRPGPALGSRLPQGAWERPLLSCSMRCAANGYVRGGSSDRRFSKRC
jgi:hypothetical protein